LRTKTAQVVELVDTLDSKSNVAIDFRGFVGFVLT